MDPTNDNELLRRYATSQSEDAFATLVRRHIDLVYSAALRECHGDSLLAEDLTQLVFADLARQAVALAKHPTLAGWLYTHVRHVAANLRRSEFRRKRRELEAFAMNDLHTDSTENTWRQLQPVLDDVMHELAEKERTALILRFFQGRSLREVGTVLGINENAARMRVERALEKLRSLLVSKGITSTSSALIGALAFGAVTTAPAHLSAAIISGTGAAVSAAVAGSTTLIQLAAMSAKTKIALLSAVVVTAVGAPIAYHQLSDDPETAAKKTAAARAAAAAHSKSNVSFADGKIVMASRTDDSSAERRRPTGKFQADLISKSTGANPATPPPLLPDDVRKEFDEATVKIRALRKEAEIQRLGQFLHLSPDQQKQVQAILKDESTLNPDGSINTVSKDLLLPAVQAELAKILTPDQMAKLKDFNASEHTTQARIDASNSIQYMLQSYAWPAEKQDKIYDLLYEDRLRELNDPVGYRKNFDELTRGADTNKAFAADVEYKLHLLKDVLTPEEQETYRNRDQTTVSSVGHFARMQQALGLDASQTQRLEAAYQSYETEKRGLIEKAQTGQPLAQNDVPRITGNGDTAVRQLLTPEQQARFDQFMADESNFDARSSAHVHMVHLQQALGLSEERQNQMYDALYQHELDKKKNPELLNQTREQTIEERQQRLSKILTPDELAMVRRLDEAQPKSGGVYFTR